MHKILTYVQALRFITFFLSLIAFLCHAAHVVLLNKYQEKSGIPDWMGAGHWQYLLWFITLGLSLVGGLAVCLSACYYNRPTLYSFDRRIAIFSLLPLFVSLITALAIDKLEPWTNGLVKVEERSASALVSSCALFDSTKDKYYPLLYQRCLLNDWTSILCILLCIFWAMLVGIAMFALSKEKKREQTAKNGTSREKQRRAEEPKWGRYIPDRPASVYSVTTLGNRSGLITPTSIKYGNSFYYGDNSSVPSLPPSKKDRYYDHYDNDDEDDDYYYSSKKDYYSSYRQKSSSPYSPTSPTASNDYKLSSPTSATTPTTSIGDYFMSKDYKSSKMPPLVTPVTTTSIGNYFTSSDYKSSSLSPTAGHYNATRNYRSGSVASSTFYNSTIAPSGYNYDHDLLNSSPTHHNSLHSDAEEEQPVVRTPLYQAFANKSKNTQFKLR